MSTPVVTTTAAYEGVGACTEDGVFVADHPKEFADALKQLLTDRETARELGDRARAYVEEHFVWSAQLERLDALIAEAASAPALAAGGTP